MHQSKAQRFERSKNNDLFVTFFPILLVFGLRGLFLRFGMSELAFNIVQVLLAVFLAVVFILSYRYYFRSFTYTVIGPEGENPLRFPRKSLTFERYSNKKSRIYERVLSKEMLALVAPGEDAGSYSAEKTYCLTPCSLKTAYRLYYRQQGKVYCALFHPDGEMQSIIRQWIQEKNNKKQKPTDNQ